MHKCLLAWVTLRPAAIVLKLDFRNAYNSAIRSAILRAISARCPDLSPIARCILADVTIHWWYGDETVAAAIHAERGVGQGSPFSPALFAILIADALDAVRDELRTVDPSVGVLSYLDDIYIVVAPDAAGRALEAVDRNFAPLGLTINPGKCKWWCGDAESVPVGLPASVARAARLPVLGAALPFVVASDLGELDNLDHDGPLRGACTALETYWQNLCKLRCEGLPLDVALNFHTTFVSGAITHFLRAKHGARTGTRGHSVSGSSNSCAILDLTSGCSSSCRSNSRALACKPHSTATPRRSLGPGSSACMTSRKQSA